MKFGPVDLSAAQGHILAHSLMVGPQRLRKGITLTSKDISDLKQACYSAVIVAQLETDDIAEDSAAAALAQALAGAHVTHGDAATGRVNLFADDDGLADFDPDIIDAVNLVSETMTIATLPRYTPVRRGQMIATIKIIPFAVRRDDLARALSAAKAAVCVHPYLACNPALVMTRLPGLKPSVLAKAEKNTRTRLSAMGQPLHSVSIADHDETTLSTQLIRLVEAGHDPILIIGASAIVDRRDTVPAAILAAGGQLSHFGMPVDPGNLLAIGSIGAARVVGLPGCARALQPNGFDWVLARLIAGLKVTGSDIQKMGVGGLLKEIVSRPQPRDMGHLPAQASKQAVGILAAGLSTRMGEDNKLLCHYQGKPLVRHVAEAALASPCDQVYVVLGHKADAIEQALAGLDVSFVQAPDYEQGMGHSLAALVKALPADTTSLLIALGDMPGVRPDTFATLLAAIDAQDGTLAAVPTYQGKRGNPVALSHRLFSQLSHLTGDQGARHLLTRLGDDLTLVAVDDPAILVDVDTPEALAQIKADQPPTG